MKGISRCVVEITDPQDESIERVLVFLKPGSRAVRLGHEKDAAQKYVQGLVSWRRNPFPAWMGVKFFLWSAAILVCGALVLWILL